MNYDQWKLMCPDDEGYDMVSCCCGADYVNSIDKENEMKTYDDFDRDYNSFTDYVMDRIDIDERKKIRKEWENTSGEMKWQDYLLKRVNQKSFVKEIETLEDYVCCECQDYCDIIEDYEYKAMQRENYEEERAEAKRKYNE